MHYILLVGINAYPMKGSALNGCVPDVKRLEKYLLDRFSLVAPEDNEDQNFRKIVGDHAIIWRLLDDAATYNNIVSSFRQHLRRAQQGDHVWFHFSGHGSEQWTAPEFKAELEPNGKDQDARLLCYTRK